MEKTAVHCLIILVPCLLLGLIPVVGWVAGAFLFVFLANKTGLFK